MPLPLIGLDCLAVYARRDPRDYRTPRASANLNLRHPPRPRTQGVGPPKFDENRHIKTNEELATQLKGAGGAPAEMERA